MSEANEIRKLIDTLHEDNEPHEVERFNRELQSISQHIKRVAQEMKNNGYHLNNHMWEMVKYFDAGVDGVTLNKEELLRRDITLNRIGKFSGDEEELNTRIKKHRLSKL